MTFPCKLEDSPAHKLGGYPGKNGTVHYSEDVFVGYRYFDTYRVQPQFPFGHGLSYTNFTYSNLKVLPAGNNKFTVKFNIRNTGTMKGAEVVQLYVKQQHPSIKRPEKELKGFKKVLLAPGKSTAVSLLLERDAFTYYDEKTKNWMAEPGLYDIMIGSSSKDIRITSTVRL